MRHAELFYPGQICILFLYRSRGSLHGYPRMKGLHHLRRNPAMSNQRRQFLGLAAGAIAAPATAGMVVAQGDPSRGREAPMPPQTIVPERRPAKSEFTGLPALLNPQEYVVLLIDHQHVQL